MPPRMHRLSGSIVAVTLCFHAASPAGVNGSFSPGRSLAMLPTGTVSRVPFQYPFKSGCPSAVRGVGFDGAGAGLPLDWAAAGVETANQAASAVIMHRIP